MSDAILLIEDGDDQRSMLTSVLADAGYEVRACANALEALALLSRWHPSAILLDWYLPHLGGESFVRCVRATLRLADVPIIVLTGASRIASAGIDAVLLKPLDVPELLAVTRRLIERPAAPGAASPFSTGLEAHR
jgi:DNA-binding response OmpR family regulator